ncbi:MAG: Trm112 family protein [Pseudomonadota bacterium]
MEKWLLEILACPVCKGRVELDRASNVLVCKIDRLGFEVRDGRPGMLESEARHLSLDELDALRGK